MDNEELLEHVELSLKLCVHLLSLQMRRGRTGSEAVVGTWFSWRQFVVSGSPPCFSWRNHEFQGIHGIPGVALPCFKDHKIQSMCPHAYPITIHHIPMGCVHPMVDLRQSQICFRSSLRCPSLHSSAGRLQKRRSDPSARRG